MQTWYTYHMKKDSGGVPYFTNTVRWDDPWKAEAALREMTPNVGEKCYLGYSDDETAETLAVSIYVQT